MNASSVIITRHPSGRWGFLKPKTHFSDARRRPKNPRTGDRSDVSDARAIFSDKTGLRTISGDSQIPACPGDASRMGKQSGRSPRSCRIRLGAIRNSRSGTLSAPSRRPRLTLRASRGANRVFVPTSSRDYRKVGAFCVNFSPHRACEDPGTQWNEKTVHDKTVLPSRNAPPAGGCFRAKTCARRVRDHETS